MTARQDARVGTRATSEGTWSYETQRAPHVGEILQTARERKGADLARAERETKIRARHLMALESGDMADLPALVYAKGFLRNYSTYLGLDGDEMVDRWRKEIDQPRSADKPAVKPPPQPITTPSRGFKLTSGLIVALVLAAIVVAFVGYVGLQLVRFTQNPEIIVSGPAIRQMQPGEEFVRVSGTSTPNAAVTATGAYDLVRTTEADVRGAWSMNLPVDPGPNNFVIISRDPETARDSEPAELIVNVPVLENEAREGLDQPVLPEGAADLDPQGIPSAELIVTEPRDNLRSKSGKVEVVGTTDADSVVVSFQWSGDPAREKDPPPSATVPAEDGVFRKSFQLPKGRWQVSVAAANNNGVPAIEQLKVTSLSDKMTLKIEAIDGGTRVNVTTRDGDSIVERKRLNAGQKWTRRVDPDVLVRVGNARAAHVTVDGREYGAMGNKVESKTWRIQQGQKPKTVSD